MPGARLRRSPGSRRRAPSRTDDPRLGSRAQVRERCARRPPPPARGGRAAARASRRTGRRRPRSRIVIRIAVVVGAHDEPLPQQRVAERAPVRRPGRRGSSPCDGSGSSPIARSARREPLALLDHRRARRAARRARRPRARPTSVETGAGAWRAFSSAAISQRGERVADARARERRRPSRTSAARSRRRRAAGRAVSPQYSKYASSTDERPGLGQRRAAPRRGCSGRQVNVSTGSSSPTSAPASCAAIR